jgi:hypothetical protein
MVPVYSVKSHRVRYPGGRSNPPTTSATLRAKSSRLFKIGADDPDSTSSPLVVPPRGADRTRDVQLGKGPEVGNEGGEL